MRTVVGHRCDGTVVGRGRIHAARVDTAAATVLPGGGRVVVRPAAVRASEERARRGEVRVRIVAVASGAAIGTAFAHGHAAVLYIHHRRGRVEAEEAAVSATSDVILAVGDLRQDRRRPVVGCGAVEATLDQVRAGAVVVRRRGIEGGMA